MTNTLALIACPGGGSGGGKYPVKARHAAQFRARAGQIQHTESTEAETHRGDPCGVHFGLSAQGFQSRTDTCLQEWPILHQPPHQPGVFLGAAAYPAFPIHIDRETHVAQLGKFARLAFGKFVPPRPRRRYEHAGQGSRRGIVQGQKSQAAGIGMHVFDGTGDDGHCADSD